MANRNINIGSGNYNETIGGDYVQGSSVETTTYPSGAYKKVTKTGNTTITETRDAAGNVSRSVVKTGGTINATGAGSFNLGDIGGTVANTINQIVQGNANRIVQQSSSNIAIGHMTGGHIGDNVTIAGNINQVVQGSGNNVSQSILSDINVGGDITLGDISQEVTYDEPAEEQEIEEVAGIIKDILGKISQAESRMETKQQEIEEISTDIDRSLDDLWADEEPRPSVKSTEAMVELAEYIDIKAESAAEVKSAAALLLAADEVVNIINNQPILITELDSNKVNFFKRLRTNCNVVTATKLINIIEASI